MRRCCLIFCLGWAAWLWAGEPSVTPAEQALLAQVETEAATAPAQALATLRAGMTPAGSAALLFAAGVLQQRLGDLPAAEAALAETLARAPDFDRARYQLAATRVQRGQPAAAIADLCRLAEAGHTEDGALWGLLGYAYLQTGQPLPAEAAYRRGLATRPDDPALRRGLAKALLDQGQLAAARPLLAAELARQPVQAEWWLLLANANLQAGATGEAMVQLECLRRLGLADAQALATLGDLLATDGLPAEALAAYRQAAALPTAPVDRLLRAVTAQLQLGRADEAAPLLATLTARTDLTPAQRSGLLLAQARLADLRGDATAALTGYRAYLAEAPLDGAALLACGDLLRRTGAADQAADCYARAVRASPPHRAPALVRLAQLALARGDRAAAAHHLREALAVAPNPALERYLQHLEAPAP